MRHVDSLGAQAGDGVTGHERLLDHLMSTHSLFGAFDANSDAFAVFMLWDPPPATDEALLAVTAVAALVLPL